MWERVRRLLAPLRLWWSDEPRDEDCDERSIDARESLARERFWAELREGQRDAKSRSRH